jgi:hypothetical protein
MVEEITKKNSRRTLLRLSSLRWWHCRHGQRAGGRKTIRRGRYDLSFPIRRAVSCMRSAGRVWTGCSRCSVEAAAKWAP